MRHYCDWCDYVINDSDEEVPIFIFELPCNEIYFFCCEDCFDKFIKDCTGYGYVNPNGAIDRD